MTIRALIIGICGQDGSYLTDLLLRKNYDVHGTMRRSSVPNLGRLEHVRSQIHLHYADLVDATSIDAVVATVEPDEVYNLGAMSDVGVSFDVPDYSGQVTGVGAARVLDAIRRHAPDARFYQAGSSEMFGMNPDVPTNEYSAFHPASPYAAAKVFAHHLTINYREAYGIHASNGILFNHESPRRGVGFVTRKITQAVAAIRRGDQKELVLGTLETARDWGHARDYVEAMWRMLQQDEPDDYVVATGEAHTVREFAQMAFDHVGLDWSRFVRVDRQQARPLDPPVLLGDSKRAHTVLGWEPSVNFTGLVIEMVEHDLRHGR